MHKYILPILLIFGLVFTVQGQRTDTLYNLLQKPDLPDTQRVNTNNLISRNLSFVDPIKALKHAQEALEISLKIKYKKGIADSYRNLGSIYSYFGSFYLTVDNLQRAISGYEDLNDSSGLANCYISLGHSYRYLKNIQKEIQYHKAAFEIHSRLGNPERIGVSAHNLGESYFNNHELDKAINLTQFAIHINDSIKNIQVLSSCYKVMGKILMAQDKLDEAEVYFKKILVISDSLKENSQKIATIEAYVQLSNIAKIKKDEKSEEYYLHKASQFIKTYYLSNYLNSIYLDLIELYVKRNQPELALKSIREYKDLSDSLNARQTQDKNQLVVGFTKVYEVEKKNSILEIENKLQNEKVRLRTLITYASIGFAILAIIFIVLLFVNWKKVRSINEQMEQKNLIIENQNKKLEEVNRTKDKFFSIVSLDLRAPLNSISLFTDFILSDKFTRLPKEQFMELAGESKMLIDSTKKLTDDLIKWAQIQMKREEPHPELVHVAGIVKEISGVFADHAAKKQITLTSIIGEDLVAFADPNQLRFIIRNLVNNAIKFTNIGGSVTISGKTTHEGITEITVSDNGVGMSKQKAETIFLVGKNKETRGTAGEASSGLGLILVWEFIQLNKGKIDVTSEVGKGTTFTVQLPGKES